MLVAIRVGLSLHAIGLPGVQQDETLFVNAATLRIPGVYIQDSFHGIPLMIFPYIGALKSWLYDPLFAIFGTSPTAIRLPAVVITSAGLLLVYPAVRDLANRSVALLAFCALCFDNSVFWFTRDDVGPSAIEFALKCAALFCVARWARSRRDRWLLLLLATLALGVFNKLNFIWIVNAATAASVLVMVRHRRAIASNVRQIALWLGGLAVIYACFAAYYFTNHIGTLLNGPSGSTIIQPWVDFQQGISGILSGTLFYSYVLAPLQARAVVVWIVLALFAWGGVASVAIPRWRSFPVATLALATVLIAVQILFTLQATAGWHYIAIYPFVTIVAAYGVYALAQAVLARRRSVDVAIACACVAVVTYSGLLTAKYFDALRGEPVNAAWSPAIYALSDDLSDTRATIFTADWGIFNPLFALHPGHRYVELAFALENPAPASLATVANTVAATPGPKLVVTHAPGAVQYPQDVVDLHRALGAHLELLQTVSGPGGHPVYRVYVYR